MAPTFPVPALHPFPVRFSASTSDRFAAEFRILTSNSALVFHHAPEGLPERPHRSLPSGYIFPGVWCPIWKRRWIYLLYLHPSSGRSSFDWCWSLHSRYSGTLSSQYVAFIASYDQPTLKRSCRYRGIPQGSPLLRLHGLRKRSPVCLAYSRGRTAHFSRPPSRGLPGDGLGMFGQGNFPRWQCLGFSTTGQRY